MNAFAIGPAELIVVLVVSVVVSGVVAGLLAVVFAWGRKSSKVPSTSSGTVDARLRELDGLRESGLVTGDEYRDLRAAILKEI